MSLRRIAFKILIPVLLINVDVNAQHNISKHMMKEVQITFAPYGHTLNATQVFSPDGEWIVYDTRNDDTQIITTSKIEQVNIKTGKIMMLYTTKNQTPYGPGVGAAAYNPLKDQVIFIHGLENSSESNPYGFTRRFGAIVDTSKPGAYAHAEARTVSAPLTEGALRGGTHAHTWSADGKCISFTYNDELIAEIEKTTHGSVKDLRTIGMMIPDQSVNVDAVDAANFAGTYFAFVTATVVDNPKSGTDEIDRSFDECWIGTNGYLKKNGDRQHKAIAFQGNVRDSKNQVVTEVFISDVPEKINVKDAALQGTLTTRPNVPRGLIQRRITYTEDQKFPGIQGPRCRLRTSPDGGYVYFHRKDDSGVVQIYRVETAGSNIDRITNFKQDIQAQYNISPDGKSLSCVSENSIWIVDVNTRKMTAVTAPQAEPIVGGALWSADGKRLVFNRYVGSGTERYLQIFALDIN